MGMPENGRSRVEDEGDHRQAGALGCLEQGSLLLRTRPSRDDDHRFAGLAAGLLIR